MGLKIKDTVISPGIVIGSGDNWMLDTLIGAPDGAKERIGGQVSVFSYLVYQTRL